jgi:hypothetical protein
MQHAEVHALILIRLAPAARCLAAEPRTDQVLSMDCCRCPYGDDAVLGIRRQQENARRRSPPFSSRPSCCSRRGADRKSSFLIPTARLEVHDLAHGPVIADSPGNRSLHNTSGTLNLSHCYLSHLTNVTFDWLALYPASLKRSTLGSNRERKTVASAGSAKQ